MSKISRLTDGSTIISLIDPTGWNYEPGGMTLSPLSDAHIVGDDPIAGQTMVSIFRLATEGIDHDDLGDKVQALIALLRKAALYHRSDGWQLDPVWLEERARSETNTRYAMILRCMEIDRLSVLIKPFDLINWIVNFGITLELEFPWRPEAPHTALPTALTLTRSQSDAPATPIHVHLANHRDDVALTDAKTYDGGVFDDIASPAGNLMSPTPATNDYTIFGSTDQPPKTIVIPALSVAAAFTTSTLSLKYYNGGWVALTLGTNYTVYPGPDFATALQQGDEDIVINVTPPSDAIKVSLDGVSAYWYKLEELHATPVYATDPLIGAVDEIYAQRDNFIEIPAASLLGDRPVRSLIRLTMPYGGLASPGLGTISRILLGSRTISLGADEFEPWLNLGNVDNPTGWATGYDADTSSVARPEAPGGFEAYCDFAADATLIPRVTLTGTNMLQYFTGRFEVMLLYKQAGGSAGDLEFMCKFKIGGAADEYPVRSTEELSSELGSRYVVVTFGEIELPLGEITGADQLDEDLIIQILAERTTGAADLYMAAILLWPIGEWAGGLVDPLSDTATGSSALRGNNAIDFDNNVLQRRAQKYLVQSDGDVIPAENWHYSGSLPSIEPGRQTRIYVLQLQYDTDWGVAPLRATPGMHFKAEIFAHAGYVMLRGDN